MLQMKQNWQNNTKNTMAEAVPYTFNGQLEDCRGVLE